MKRVLIAAAGLALAGGAAAADEMQGRVLAMSCMNCHGPAGRSAGPIPSIAGKTALYIKTAMVDFRGGKRSSTVMTRLAKGYSDAEIDALSSYVATLK